MTVLDKILRMGEGRELRRLESIAKVTNGLESVYEELSDTELRELTGQFKKRRAKGESLESLMPEAFAAVREASRRTLGLRHFDVQLMGGAALFGGNIAEMKTGEGKTLVATLPAYLRALDGQGVHIVTVNDYLAHYQSDLMGRVFRFLGMETGCILTGMPSETRRAQYLMDITYGTNNEFGFDYLRDNMAMAPADLVQRGHHFAIVDEVDSILIDEARTPLLISGPASGDNNKWYGEFARIARQLTPEVDYEVDEKKRVVGMLEAGIDKVERALGITNLYDAENTPLIGFLNAAVRAKELFRRDRDYVVQAGEVDIVDEHTGRLLKGRRYSEGLHQAIEAKEGVPVKQESQTYASITLQNYFRLYEVLSGMTGTAQTEAAELNSTYGMNVIPIPTNMPMIRADQPDVLFKNEAAKYAAIVEDIVERNALGQPILVGTTSVEKSERLSKELRKHGIKHSVLNAKQHEQEAAIVAEAGRWGAVTVATNMAGRGTDIMLGGNPEFRAVKVMAERGLDPAANAAEYEAEWDEVFATAKSDVSDENRKVLDAGGLYVLGTERHESRRIDNQLRGRSGRQGDPGESRFYLSLEDDLMRVFQTGLASTMLNSTAFPDDMPIESKVLTRGVRSAQAQIESRNHEIRKNILKYDDVMSNQRMMIYGERRRVLDGEDFKEQISGFIDDVVKEYVSAATATGAPDDWDLEGLWRDLGQVFPISLTIAEVTEEAGGLSGLTGAFLTRELTSDAHVQYAAVEERIGAELMRTVERQVVLQVLDNKWREHLYEMDYLKEGIGLRAMGQRDPLMEYQREGFQLFDSMTDALKEQSIQVLYRVEKRVAPPAPPVEGEATAASATSAAPATTTGQPVRRSATASTSTGGSGNLTSSFSAVTEVATPKAAAPKNLTYSAPSLDGDAKVTRTTAAKPEDDLRTFPGTAKNAQCPCGSGKKYKACHGKNET